MKRIILAGGVVIMLMMSMSGVTLALNGLVWAKVYQLLAEMETEK